MIIYSHSSIRTKINQFSHSTDNNEYMAFGISPNPDKTEMVASDAAVAWVDHATGKGFAIDYFLNAKSQCAGKKGSCPDENIEVVLKNLLKPKNL